jgi:hypothetical protein
LKKREMGRWSSSVISDRMKVKYNMEDAMHPIIIKTRMPFMFRIFLSLFNLRRMKILIQTELKAEKMNRNIEM